MSTQEADRILIRGQERPEELGSGARGRKAESGRSGRAESCEEAGVGSRLQGRPGESNVG